MRHSDAPRVARARGPESPRKYIPALISVVTLGLLALVTAPGFIALGKPGGVKYSLAFAVLFLTAALYGFQTRIRERRSVNGIALSTIEGAGATRILYSKKIFGYLLVLAVCPSAISVFATIDFYQAIGTGRVVAPEAGAVVAAVAGVFFLLFPIQVAAGRIRPGSVALTSTGIYHRGWTFQSFLPWSAFTGIKTAYFSTPEILLTAYRNTQWKPRNTAILWNIEKAPPVPMIDVNCAYFDGSPELLYDILRFYLENPDARVELDTEASSKRIAERRLS